MNQTNYPSINGSKDDHAETEVGGTVFLTMFVFGALTASVRNRKRVTAP